MIAVRSFSLVLFLAVLSGTLAKFRVVREWNYVNFTWPDSETYQNAFLQQGYIPENNILAGIKYFEGFYYVTHPRMRNGVPATLSRIPAGNTNDTSPLFTPYPSWEMNNLHDCDSLQNVQNIEIDPKGQIWIIDGGRTETLGRSPVVKCKPKLVVYDIKEMKTVFTYTFPENVASFNGSFLYDIVVDDTDGGFAYITDNGGRDPGIIVYSVKQNRSWKIRHSQSMHADPNAVFFKVNGVGINAPLNLASIALGPKLSTNGDRVVINEDREVFYTPISSLHIYSINTSVLKNDHFAMDDGEYQGQVTDHGLKASQTVGMVMDNEGVLYYSLLGSNSIARWDIHTPFQTGQKIIAKDERYLEWPNSFALDKEGNLTILVNRLERFIYDKLDLKEPNFRLIASNVGGMNYLYDDSYSYNNQAESSSTSSTTESEELKPINTGLDQDPYLSPQPEPEPSANSEEEHSSEPSPEPEPSAEPEPSPEPSGSEASSSTAHSTTVSENGSTRPLTASSADRTTSGVIFGVVATITIFYGL
ncbi:protein yellow-like [Sitophilus oryzae]|uniref:Protein yellow-like n=1 Tax=Sitophilus oryzae TaxID=7048 RepID=A0A6J2XH85_SITOR|nr:protein yellow-like [Sitophilus oryzae]